MATVVGPSRNPVVAAAFAALRKSERAEKKSSKKQVEPEPIKKPKQPRSTGGKPTKGKK